MFEKSEPILTSTERAELVTIMNCKYAASLRGRRFSVEDECKSSFAQVTVTLSDEQRRFFYPVEGIMAHDEQGLEKKEAALFLIDYLDFYFIEYFQDDEDLYLPVDWDPRSFEGIEFRVRGQKRNLEKERLADEWLMS